MDDQPTARERRENPVSSESSLSLSLLVYNIPNRHFLHLLQDPYLNMQTRNTGEKIAAHFPFLLGEASSHPS